MAVKILTKSKKFLLVGVAAIIVLACLIAGIFVWQLVDWDKGKEVEDDYDLEPSDSILGVYSNGAVSTDAPYCAKIGTNILRKGGSAADGAIAAAICVGLVQTQSMGLGGGFLAVHYNASNGKAEALTAREQAPNKATEDMFKGNASLSARGPLAIAVPGELKGYWELYKKYGKLPWKDLFSETISLAEKGFNVTYHAANALRSNRNLILDSPTLKNVFVNPKTKQIYREGETITRSTLAKTLREIAETDAEEKDLFYQNHRLMRELVKDLQKEGGLITEDDMLNYNVAWEDSVGIDIGGDFKVHSVPPPGSGILLGFIFRILKTFNLKTETVISYQQIVESFKHAYAKRTLLGDPADEDITDVIKELRRNLTESDEYLESILKLIHKDQTNSTYEYYGAEFYQPEDHGTSHLSVIDADGNAVALTSTVNLYFGSMVRSVRTGVIFNDQMDDFSSPNISNSFGVPPSVNNFIRPHKRPVSSMVPSIFTDKNGKARLVIGGAGGTKITTAVTTVAIRNLWFGEDIKRAIDARRIHHQLYPMQLQYEEGFNPRIIEGLEKLGHDTDQFSLGTSVVTAVAVAENGTIFANADFRKRGTSDGY